MDIILIQDVPNLGYKNEIATVRPGYARNYLIPQKLAITANPTNKKILTENLKQAKHKIGKVKADAEALAAALASTNIKITAKVGTTDKIFGSVTTLQISHALKDAGYDIDRRKIHITEDIKTLGTYHATVDLHREVKAQLTLVVAAEEEAQA